ncbi:MAG: regulatory protein RecX [Proteobacteria bacterium]|nr:regulatory protein RecX [Pseudomonadota bacterium]
MNEIFDTAIKLLSNKNHSSMELKTILEQQFSSLADSQSLIDQTMVRLEELHLISDEFIANSQAQRYMHKGNQFISQKLKQKGFDKAYIDTLIEQLPCELERALPEAQKKLKSIASHDARTQENKLLRFLSGRGFGANTCYQVINHLKEEGVL